MHVNRSAPKATVTPILIYSDVAEAIGWLCGAFGFRERLRVPGRDGIIGHAQLAIADGAVMLGVRGGPFSPPRPGEVTQYVHVTVEDVDIHYQRAKHFGARIVHGPTDMPFGVRQYTAEDHAGHRWTFSQNIADVAPEDWGAISAKLD